MAEEVKKIITVEVGKSITSVRDFKKHIEDLRGALLGLNEESEEYKTIAEQIATDQAKLNEVMKVGKGNTDSAAGSYNELNNQLKALRNQYKALSETERNSTTGQAILQNINKLDTQLKDIDASIGQYQRNVGNYKQAFEGAFQTILGEVGKINPQLGTLISTVQKLIPVFKGVGTAAKGAGTSIKAAMTSTGVGILLVALGEIVAHWKEISTWARRVLGIQEKITTETKKSKQEAKAYADTLGEALSKYERIMRSLGRTQEDIYNGQLNILNTNKSNISIFKGQAAALRQELNNIRQDYANAAKNRDNAKMEEQVKNLQNFVDRYAAAAKVWGIEIGDISYTISGWGGDFTRNMNNISQSLSDATEKLKENSEKTDQAITDLNESYKEFANTENTNMKKRAENIGKTEEEIRRQQYEDEVAGAKKRLDARIISQKEYDEFVKNAALVLEDDLKKIRNQSSTSRQEGTDDGLQAILDRLKDFGKSELEILYDNWQRERAILIEHHEDTSKLDAEYYQKREEIIKNNAEEENRIIQEAYEAQEQLRRNNFNKSIQDLYDREDKELHNVELWWTKNTSPNTGWNFWDYMFGKGQDNESKINEQIDKIFEIRSGALQDQINAYSQYLGTLKKGSDEYIEIERQKTQAVMELDNLRFEHVVELNDRELRMQERKRDAIQTIMSNTVSIYSSFTDAMLVNEEQGSNRWKAFKTSEAVVNMLSGILAAFMSGFNSGLPAPWNIALAASTAGVAAAAGAAQIAQIQATKMGSTSSASNAITGGGASGVGVQPLLNPDYDLQRITNLSLQSDAFLPGNTQVYVLESDIQEVGNRVQVRENNATF